MVRIILGIIGARQCCLHRRGFPAQPIFNGYCSAAEKSSVVSKRHKK